MRSLCASHTSISSLIFSCLALSLLWNSAMKHFWNCASVKGSMSSRCLTSPFAYHTPWRKVSAVFVSILTAINSPYTGMSFFPYFSTASDTCRLTGSPSMDSWREPVDIVTSVRMVNLSYSQYRSPCPPPAADTGRKSESNRKPLISLGWLTRFPKASAARHNTHSRYAGVSSFGTSMPLSSSASSIFLPPPLF